MLAFPGGPVNIVAMSAWLAFHPIACRVYAEDV